MTQKAPGRGRQLGIGHGTRLLVLFAVATLLLFQQHLVRQLRVVGPSPGWEAQLLVPLALVSAALFVQGRWRALVLAATAGLYSVMLLADLPFLSFFQRPFSLTMAALAGQLWAVRASTSALLDPLPLLACVVVFVLAGLDLWLAGSARFSGRAALAARLLAVIGLAALAPAFTRATAPDARNIDLVFLQQRGVGAYHIKDTLQVLADLAGGEHLDDTTRSAIMRTLAHKQQLNDTPSPLFGIAAGRNVILIQLEAVQRFAVGLEVEGGPVTPTLDALSRTALRWDRCVDTTQLGRTSDAEFGVLSGLLPDPRRPPAWAFTTNRYTTLPRTLADERYHSLTLHAFKPIFWNRAVMHPAYGIDKLHFRGRFGAGPKLGMGLEDRIFLERAADLLAVEPEPFLALVITLSGHHPYHDVPEALRDWPVGLPDDSMIADYLRLVHYTDQALGEFLERLAASGLDRRSLIVIYGDHDAALDMPSRYLVRDQLGTDLSTNAADCVPLLIAVPGEEAVLAAHADSLTGVLGGLHDIPPTVLHLLGLASPAGFFGTHLFVPADERDVLPLPRSGDFVANGRFVNGTDTESGLDGETRGELARQARQAWLVSEAILQYDGQTLVDGLSPERLAELAGQAPPWLDERNASAVDWTQTLEGRRPLADSRELIPFIPHPPDGLNLELTLENTGEQRVEYRLEGRGERGEFVGELTGRLAPGERRRVPLSQAQELERAAYVWLERGSATAELNLEHALGVIHPPLLTGTCSSMRVSGAAEGLVTLGLIVVNLGPDQRLQRSADVGAGTQQRSVDLPAGSAFVEQLVVPTGAERIEVTLTGKNLAVQVLQVSLQDDGAVALR